MLLWDEVIAAARVAHIDYAALRLFVKARAAVEDRIYCPARRHLCGWIRSVAGHLAGVSVLATSTISLPCGEGP